VIEKLSEVELVRLQSEKADSERQSLGKLSSFKESISRFFRKKPAKDESADSSRDGLLAQRGLPSESRP
jgi:hypothetical protein